MEDFINLAISAQGEVTALATVVIAVMAVVTGVLTYALIRENRLLRKAGTEPNVVAYLTTHSRRPTMTIFVLANIGEGAACNVRFRFQADEQDFTSHKVRLNNSCNRAAIGMLPQGEKIEAFFGGHELYQNDKLRPFIVVVEYEDIKGRRRISTHSLDVSQFDGFSILGEPAEHEIAEALKKIEKHLNRFATGTTRLKVEIDAARVTEINDTNRNNRVD